MENTVVSENQSSNDNVEQKATSESAKVALKDISIDDENVALNVMVGMLNIAQKRGAFSLEESAKTWECVQMFMRNPSPASQ